MSQDSPIRPPLSNTSARRLVAAVAAAWNSRDPDAVAMRFARHATWQAQGQSLRGRSAIREHLEGQWRLELHHRVAFDLQTCDDNALSLRVDAEWQHGRSGQWFRSSGIEHWEINDYGLIERRDARLHDIPIRAEDRSIGI